MTGRYGGRRLYFTAQHYAFLAELVRKIPDEELRVVAEHYFRKAFIERFPSFDAGKWDAWMKMRRPEK